MLFKSNRVGRTVKWNNKKKLQLIDRQSSEGQHLMDGIVVKVGRLTFPKTCALTSRVPDSSLPVFVLKSSLEVGVV